MVPEDTQEVLTYTPPPAYQPPPPVAPVEAPRIPLIPRAEVRFQLQQAGLLLTQAHGLLEAVTERGWEGWETDLAAISTAVQKARWQTSGAYFNVNAACGLFVPRSERDT